MGDNEKDLFNRIMNYLMEDIHQNYIQELALNSNITNVSQIKKCLVPDEDRFITANHRVDGISEGFQNPYPYAINVLYFHFIWEETKFFIGYDMKNKNFAFNPTLGFMYRFNGNKVEKSHSLNSAFHSRFLVPELIAKSLLFSMKKTIRHEELEKLFNQLADKYVQAQIKNLYKEYSENQFDISVHSFNLFLQLEVSNKESKKIKIIKNLKEEYEF